MKHLSVENKKVIFDLEVTFKRKMSALNNA